MDKKTPLYDIHVKLGGAPVSFAGYLLPMQYSSTGILKEHNAVRESVGVFDCSHMGEFIIEGKGAAVFLDYLVTNTVSAMTPGLVRYSPMCNERGGVVDDLLVYKLGAEKFMLVVNASNKDKDFAWIKKHLAKKQGLLGGIKKLFGKGIKLNDISDHVGLVALQGRKAVEILKTLVNEEEIPKKNYTFVQELKIAGKNVLLSRTGYTGEDGFEFYVAWDELPAVFEEILKAGKPFGIVPCGLGARDTLRLEAAMPLYGHEMHDEITPLEAGLARWVRFDKADFVGKAAMQAKGDPKIKRVGLELIDKGIAREHCDIFDGNEKIGYVTSGTMSPYSNKAIAMGMIDILKENVQNVQIDVRGRRLAAQIVQLPFYKKNY